MLDEPLVAMRSSCARDASCLRTLPGQNEITLPVVSLVEASGASRHRKGQKVIVLGWWRCRTCEAARGAG